MKRPDDLSLALEQAIGLAPSDPLWGIKVDAIRSLCEIPCGERLADRMPLPVRATVQAYGRTASGSVIWRGIPSGIASEKGRGTFVASEGVETHGALTAKSMQEAQAMRRKEIRDGLTKAWGKLSTHARRRIRRLIQTGSVQVTARGTLTVRREILCPLLWVGLASVGLQAMRDALPKVTASVAAIEIPERGECLPVTRFAGPVDADVSPVSRVGKRAHPDPVPCTECGTATRHSSVLCTECRS